MTVVFDSNLLARRFFPQFGPHHGPGLVRELMEIYFSRRRPDPPPKIHELDPVDCDLCFWGPEDMPK